MASRRPHNCKVCGRHESEAGPISWRGLCKRDALLRTEANNAQVAAGAGPFAAHRERRQLMASQRRLIAMQQNEA